MHKRGVDKLCNNKRTIFWGSLYTASKVLLDVIQPFTLLCLRYIIAAIAMTIL